LKKAVAQRIDELKQNDSMGDSVMVSDPPVLFIDVGGRVGYVAVSDLKDAIALDDWLIGGFLVAKMSYCPAEPELPREPGVDNVVVFPQLNSEIGKFCAEIRKRLKL